MSDGGPRAALVTGVSHHRGIGFAVARRLLADGLDVMVHAWPAPPPELMAELPGVDLVEADFHDPGAPAAVVARAGERFGGLDVMVVNHAADCGDSLLTTTAEQLDRTWAINARAAVLLCQAFARQPRVGGDGRIVLFTSGQHREPMPEELSYAISKGALHQMTRTLADALADDGVTVNAVNPGPVDTGWPSDEWRERLAPSFPGGRWGQPEDIAAVVAWLCSRDSAWVTGHVLDAEGGFRRRAAGA